MSESERLSDERLAALRSSLVDECMRLRYGTCATRGCLVRGGWQRGDGNSYHDSVSNSRCTERDLFDALAELQRRRTASVGPTVEEAMHAWQMAYAKYVELKDADPDSAESMLACQAEAREHAALRAAITTARDAEAAKEREACVKIADHHAAVYGGIAGTIAAAIRSRAMQEK